MVIVGRNLEKMNAMKSDYDTLMKAEVVCVTKSFYRAFKFITRFGPKRIKRNLTMIVNTGRMKSKK